MGAGRQRGGEAGRGVGLRQVGSIRTTNGGCLDLLGCLGLGA